MLSLLTALATQPEPSAWVETLRSLAEQPKMT
jgi:hypothetical protein